MKFALLLDLTVVGVYDTAPVTTVPGVQVIETEETVTNGMVYIEEHFHPGNYNDFLKIRHIKSPEQAKLQMILVDLAEMMAPYKAT